MKNCPSYPGYAVTTDGGVFTHRRRFGLGQGNGGGVRIDPCYSKKLKGYTGHGGYIYYSISTRGVQRSMPIHVLIMDAFVGPRPVGMEVCHSDGDPLNNHPSNLSYGTVADNASDRIKHGRQPRGESHGKAILTITDVQTIRRLHVEGVTMSAIALQMHIGESTVWDIVKKRRWAHVK